MAGVIKFSPAPTIRSLPPLRRSPNRTLSVKVSSETPLDSASFDTKEVSKPAMVISPPPDFKAPTPRRFSVRPDRVFDVLGASLSLFFRLGTGVFVSGYSASFVPSDQIPSDQYALQVVGFKVKEASKLGPRPVKPIEIYEFESCPFCRKVREIVSVLDLDVLYYPCPRNGPNFRPKAGELGGKQQFPYMVDPNTGISMYESDGIIKYLVGKYGDGSVPIMLSLGLFTTLTEGFAMIGRMGKGSFYTLSKQPPKPVELWAYEGSPFCKVVREVLVELELPHLLRRYSKTMKLCISLNDSSQIYMIKGLFATAYKLASSYLEAINSCARGSPKRQILYERTGNFQVPYLDDPNTGVQLFESAEIVDYLRATYVI